MIIELIAVIGSILMMCVPVVSWNLRRSRCTHSECFCGKCDRTLMTLEEQRLDNLKKIILPI
jgi:hypothetical protein